MSCENIVKVKNTKDPFIKKVLLYFFMGWIVTYEKNMKIKPKYFKNNQIYLLNTWLKSLIFINLRKIMKKYEKIEIKWLKTLSLCANIETVKGR